MNFYRTILQHGAVAPQDYSHHATFGEAHTAARGYSKTDAPSVRIELIDVSSDKTGILSLLRGYDVQDGHDNIKVLRMWDLTPRGGARELAPAGFAEAMEAYYPLPEEPTA